MRQIPLRRPSRVVNNYYICRTSDCPLRRPTWRGFGPLAECDCDADDRNALAQTYLWPERREEEWAQAAQISARAPLLSGGARKRRLCNICCATDEMNN